VKAPASIVWLAGITAVQVAPQPPFTLPVQYAPGAPIFIEDRVNDSAPMRFILDSASSFSMISSVVLWSQKTLKL